MTEDSVSRATPYRHSRGAANFLTGSTDHAANVN